MKKTYGYSSYDVLLAMLFGFFIGIGIGALILALMWVWLA